MKDVYCPMCGTRYADDGMSLYHECIEFDCRVAYFFKSKTDDDERRNT